MITYQCEKIFHIMNYKCHIYLTIVYHHWQPSSARSAGNSKCLISLPTSQPSQSHFGAPYLILPSPAPGEHLLGTGLHNGRKCCDY